MILERRIIMGYSIYKINFDIQTYTILYDCIDNIQDADLLAQLAMCNKNINELIFICAGCNRGINDNQTLYNKALELAKEYKNERK
jgi:hypothetical protein